MSRANLLEGGRIVPRVALWFFALAPIHLLIGMSLGIFMGAVQDFSLMPVHAHLNLIGWVTMALYGTFYALAPSAPRFLAWTTFWLNNAGVIVMIPSLAMVLKFGENSMFLLPLIVSEFVAAAAAACFILSVWSVLLKDQAD
jgi:hypothetical protein